MKRTTGKRTYIGWTTGDGRRLVAVLDGAVMFPLPGPGGAPALSWGRAAPGGRALAQAILADALGPDAYRRSGNRHVEAFVAEVVSDLADPEFELPALSVLIWAARRADRVLQSS